MASVTKRGAITSGGRSVKPTEKKTGADLASAVVTSTGTGTAFNVEDATQIDAHLSVTAVAGAGTVALKLQSSLNGTNWWDCPPGAFPTQSAAAEVEQSFVCLGVLARWAWTITGTSVTFSVDTQARRAL